MVIIKEGYQYLGRRASLRGWWEKSRGSSSLPPSISFSYHSPDSHLRPCSGAAEKGTIGEELSRGHGVLDCLADGNAKPEIAEQVLIQGKGENENTGCLQGSGCEAFAWDMVSG